jgi:hypothetical protein
LESAALGIFVCVSLFAFRGSTETVGGDEDVDDNDGGGDDDD